MKTATTSAIVILWSVAIGATAAPEPATQPATPQPAQPVTLAVLDYDASAPGNPQLGSQIAEILTARLSIDETLALVERAKLSKIIEEQKLKLRGLTATDEAVKVGKLLGAKLLVMGKSFVMDKKLMIITKVVGVETGRVIGTIRTVELSKPLSEAVMLLAEDISALLGKSISKLLPAGAKRADPLGEIRKALGEKPRPTVAVIVPETHLTRIIVDPAVETEIKRLLIACGFTVVDTGANSLADWARRLRRGQRKPWPDALAGVDLVVVGEAFSEFAVRTGDLVTCVARAEINLIDRRNGEILLADRDTQRAVDLAEALAGKTALQHAGRRLGLAVCRRLIKYKLPAKPPAATKPASRPATGSLPSGTTCVPALSAGLFAVLTAALPTAAGPEPATRPVERTVFAAPFENVTGDDQYDPAAAGMGDLVAILLARQQHITSVERQQLAALAAEQTLALKGLTGTKYALRAGKLLKADTVLTGRLFLVKGKLMVAAKALEISTARVLAADDLACRPAYLMEAALGLASRLSKQMALPLPKIDLKTIDKSPIAGLHFAKALSHYYAGNMDSAIMQFMRTLDLDPNYTEVAYFSGMAYHRLGEHAHAIIEWERYLSEHPDAQYSAEVKALLAEARKHEKDSQVQRLGP